MTHEVRYKPSCRCGLCVTLGKLRQEKTGNAEPYRRSLMARVAAEASEDAALVANAFIDELLNFRPEDF